MKLASSGAGQHLVGRRPGPMPLDAASGPATILDYSFDTMTTSLLSATVPRRILRLAPWYFAALLACGDGPNEPTVPRASAVGEWELRSRDGEPLPLRLSDGTILLSARLTMRDDSTFVMNPRYRRGEDTQWMTSITGIWSETSAGRLSYEGYRNNFEIATGTFSAKELTFVQYGWTYEFTRR